MEALERVAFEDVRIAVPWGFVCGRWYGNRIQRPIVAIHGWQDNLGTWDPLIPLLLSSSNIGILCLDMPGHGWSSPYPPGIVYHLFDYVPIIQRIMKAYKWSRISLMGHSMGAIVSVVFAGLYPQAVDLLITIDIVQPPLRPIERIISEYRRTFERVLKEDDRTKGQPIAFDYKELEEILVKGTRGSVEPSSCKYLLNRNIRKSQTYPQKYYFARDARLKDYVRLPTTTGLNLEFARKIRNIPHLAIKAKRSPYVSVDSAPVIQVYTENNPLFELHEVDGTHNVNVNNARECAAVLRPFLQRYRATPSKL